MIKNLTNDQIKLMATVRDEWLSLIFDCKTKVDKPKATELIKWLYTSSGLKEPEQILFVESPLGAQYACNMLKADVESNVWGNVNSNVWGNVNSNVRGNVEINVLSNVESNVWSNVNSNVWSNVLGNVNSNVNSNVWSNVLGNVNSNVNSNVRSNQLEYFSFSAYGSVSDYGWLSFYDFFERIGLEYQNEGFTRFKELVRCGIYDMIQLEKVCVVCSLPSKIKREVNEGVGVLHSITESAIAWEDGYEQHYLWGVYFDPELFNKVTSKGVTFKELLSIKNTEQRMAALKLYGAEALLIQSGAKLLHRSDRGNELYEVTGVFEDTEYALKFSCPSTGRVYVEFCDPEIIGSMETPNADRAQASMWEGLSYEEYMNTTEET